QPPPQQPAPPRASGSTGSSTAAGSGTYVWPSDVGEGASRSAPPRPEGTKTAETKTAYALPPAAAPSGSGAFLVQLAAVSTAEQAQAAWSRLRGNNGDLLAGLSPSYARTDLGSKGVVYRLRAGPVQGETRARALCAQLSGRNVDCMVVRAGG
ncbi:MAG: SPOR domain-containing protein, partial [Rhodospirillales bacterium]|nr:SPOR domain-containing protein [Rhodospirillales bacterium]